MGPLWLVVAGLALWGCASRRSEEVSPKTPWAPPTPAPCKDSFAGASLGSERLFPCRSGGWVESPYFRALPGGSEWSPSHRDYLASLTAYTEAQGLSPAEVLRLARKILPADSSRPFKTVEKTQALGVAVTLLSAKKLTGFFSKEYGPVIEQALRKAEEGRLKLRSVDSGAASLYSVEEDALQFRSAFPASFSSEARQEILGALYDLHQDSLGVPIPKTDHAFWRATLQSLYHTESSGIRLETLSPGQFEELQKTQFQTQEGGSLKGLALQAFFEGLKDVTQRFEAVSVFARRYEEGLLLEAFQIQREEAARKSPYHPSWDEILVDQAPQVKKKALDPKALQGQIQKLEREKKEKWEAFQQAFRRAEERKAAEDKKSRMILREPTEAERAASLRVRKRFDALIQTWSALIFFKEMQKSSDYTLKEIGTVFRPEEEMARTLAPFGILGAEKISFNKLK